MFKSADKLGEIPRPDNANGALLLSLPLWLFKSSLCSMVLPSK
jgi:hypothetical protein